MPGKVRITNHNNDNNDNPFRKKMEVFPLFCGHQHIPLRYRRRSRRVKQFVSYGYVCCQETKVILLLYSLKSFFHRVSACVTTHRSRQKNLYILQTESQSMNSFKKNKKESYLLPYDDQLSLTHLVAQTEVVHSLVQRLWNAFKIDHSCFNFSLIY